MDEIWLVELHGDNYYEIDVFPATVGRNSINAVQIKHSAISRIHFRIGREGDQHFWIQPFDTKNETFVNGEVVPQNETRQLEAKDVIEVGDVALKVTLRKSKILDGKERAEHANNSGAVNKTARIDADRLLSNKIDKLYEEVGKDSDKLAARLGVTVEDVERILDKMDVKQ
jgi:predicted component of type VI protein secretion system